MAHFSTRGNGSSRHSEPQRASGLQLPQQPRHAPSINSGSRPSLASGTRTTSQTSKQDQQRTDLSTGRLSGRHGRSARSVEHLSFSLQQDYSLEEIDSLFYSPSYGGATIKVQRSEIDAFYRKIKRVNCLQRAPARRPIGGGSISSNEYGSTLSSTTSATIDHSYPSYSATGTCEEFEDWSMRWSIDSVGKAPGQLRGPKGVCILQNSGDVVVADSKNARLQVFDGSSGRLLAVIGDGSSDQCVANTFHNATNRKMEPAGLCETPDGSLLVVTDHNRLLYIDAVTRLGGLQSEAIVLGKRQLPGLAITEKYKLILTEIGTVKPSVGLYENDGRLIRAFKGDFRSPTYVTWNGSYGVSAVSDSEMQSVMLYDAANGKLIKRFGNVSSSSGGVVPTPFGYPSGISWFDVNRLLVADRSESSVMALDLRNLSIMNVLDESSDGLRHPVSMATDGRNGIVLTEEFYDYGVSEFKIKMFRLATL